MSEAGYTASGWVRDENGVLRRETKPHMGRRLPGYDYRKPGYYVITIVLADRRSGALGELVVRRKPPACAGGATTDGRQRDLACASGATTDGSRRDLACAGGAATDGRRRDLADGWVSVDEAKTMGLGPDEVEAKIVYSPLGRAIFAHFRRMGMFTPGLSPVYCAVMPDHLHLLIEVFSELKRPLGNAIGGFKTGCEKIAASMGHKGRLFEEGFVDEVVFRAGQLMREFDYLKDNPRRLAIKRLFPELFKVSRKIRVNFRLAPKGLERPPGEGLGSVSSAQKAPAFGWFSAIGNHFLLSRAAFHQVQVSRRFFAYARDSRGRLLKDSLPAIKTVEFGEKLDAALAAAKRGDVVISPCISQGEREIARQVFASGGRVVTLANKGFSPLYKPGGKLFESCAAGNLLMLAPIGWPYLPAEKTMTRVDAQIMNRIAQLIAGDGAVEIDYKGAVMSNLENEVRDACAASF